MVKSKQDEHILRVEHLRSKIFDNVATILNFISILKADKYFDSLKDFNTVTVDSVKGAEDSIFY